MTHEEEKLIELLAYIYARIPFAKYRFKNIYDVWNHRIRSAATRATLTEAVSRLANFFGLQSIPAEAVNLIDELQHKQDILLEKLIREHVVFSMKSALRGKQLKEERKARKKQKKI